MIAYELFDLIWIACLTKKKKNTLYYNQYSLVIKHEWLYRIEYLYNYT